MKSTSWESDRERERMVEGLNDSASLTKNRAEVHFRWPVCNDDDTVARQRATPLPDAHMYLGVHTRCKSAADTRDYVCTPWAARVVPIVSVRASGRGNSHAGKGTSPDGIRGETADSCIDLPLLLFFVRQIYEFHIPFSLSLSLSLSLSRSLRKNPLKIEVQWNLLSCTSHYCREDVWQAFVMRDSAKFTRRSVEPEMFGNYWREIGNYSGLCSSIEKIGSYSRQTRASTRLEEIPRKLEKSRIAWKPFGSWWGRGEGGSRGIIRNYSRRECSRDGWRWAGIPRSFDRFSAAVRRGIIYGSWRSRKSNGGAEITRLSRRNWHDHGPCCLLKRACTHTHTHTHIKPSCVVVPAPSALRLSLNQYPRQLALII